jgi:hypothetical protein
MRAYPAKAKNRGPAACSTPLQFASVPMPRRALSAAPAVKHVTTTVARTARTTATMARVSQAAWTPA